MKPNGAVYAAEKDWPSGENSLALVMPPERSLDIDTEIDLVMGEAFLRGRPG